MAFATMQPLGELRQRARREFCVRHLRDKLAETLAQFVAGIFDGRGQQNSRDGLRPELQQRGTHRQIFARGRRGEPGKF